jgi:hypothetical protein
MWGGRHSRPAPAPTLRAVNPAGPPPKLLDRVRQALLTRDYVEELLKRPAGPISDDERNKLGERYRWEVVGPNPL